MLENLSKHSANVETKSNNEHKRKKTMYIKVYLCTYNILKIL